MSAKKAKNQAPSESILQAFKNKAVQRKPNNTGLPDDLKRGVESLSGYSMDDVNVHYNSSEPASLQAHAYAQGTDIHIAPGQEKHLPHEAWHVVQQKQGRVKPTSQVKGININDNERLEKEADVMGEKAIQLRTTEFSQNLHDQSIHMDPISVEEKQIVQRVVYPDMATMWAAVAPLQQTADILAIIEGNPALNTAYGDMVNSLGFMNFVELDGRQPEAELQSHDGLYNINFGSQNTQQEDFADNNRFVGAILHEMMHIHAALAYNTNIPQGMAHGANMHLPVPLENEEVFMPMGATMSQYNGQGGIDEQQQTMYANWERARLEVGQDQNNGDITQEQADLFNNRIDYAENIVSNAHYDTVLIDVIYYLEGNNLQNTRLYEYTTRMLTEANQRRQTGEGLVEEIDRADLPQAPEPRRRSWCYITTACVQYKGLPDDCEELTVLRGFRDSYLIERPDGKNLIKLYYDYAPLILTQIKKRRGEEEILAELYGIIRKCVDAILKGDNDFAYRIYCRMMWDLKERFIPSTEIPLKQEDA